MALGIVYTDVDGTLVGPRGSFFAAADGSFTLEPARALLALHEAGVPLVLVSGRGRLQLVQDALMLGAAGFIGELGGVIGWGEPAFRTERLQGAGDPATPELVSALTGRFDLEVFAPWHEGHEVDVLMRGHADVEAVDAWLATTAQPHLRLRDNGRTSRRPHDDRQPHVFHLIPDGISKGAAVAQDLARRGIPATDALAIGDSVSDLEMAPHMGRMALVANATTPGVLPANASVTSAAMGLGWAEAVLSALRP